MNPQGVEPNRATGVAAERHQLEVDGESYLTRLYGRAPYEGLRRTLKKSPYLRLSSPASPVGRKPRPRLVESVRGQKVDISKCDGKGSAVGVVKLSAPCLRCEAEVLQDSDQPGPAPHSGPTNHFSPSLCFLLIWTSSHFQLITPDLRSP